MARIIDLSLDIYDKAPTFWPDPKTSVTPHLKIENLKYNITRLVMSTHLGTHMDAPFHFFDEGKTVDQLDLSRGIGPAWVLNFTHKGPKEQITLEDLQPHAEKIKAGARLIIHTGWDKVFPEDRYFTDCPGLTPQACQFLADKKIAALAMDMPTVHGPEYVEVHHSLLGAEVLIIEGLAHLEKLTCERVLLIAAPLKIQGCDGSPCRALAMEGFEEEILSPFDHLEEQR
jgi:kynurenine formamidase